MTLYSIQKTYDKNDKIKYQILPYDFIGSIKTHFDPKLHYDSTKYSTLKRIKSFCQFIKTCRLSEKSAKKIIERIE